ncbi:MAG: hypothetical protein EPN25_03905 [Nitrospirae bacterium]|nr:MAG: hypothetical protein EPN25_03905 [Nitrospirota bacterium]
MKKNGRAVSGVRHISLLVLSVLAVFAAPASSGGDSCVLCHGDRARISEQGAPQFYLTEEAVRQQTRMQAACTDCHLGNPRAALKDEAHQGVVSARLSDPKFNVINRNSMPAKDREAWKELRPEGTNRSTHLLPKVQADGRLRDNPAYNLLLLQDKNPLTFAFNPVIAEQTCGKCHTDIVQSFLKSPMGGAAGAHTQSQYRAWTGPAGPQSCGLWTGQLTRPGQDNFTTENMNYYNEHSTARLSEKMSHNTQRTCNKCHVGCLDCHLDTRKKAGNEQSIAHTFVKKPSSFSCYGGGKAFICHAGPLERRRGDGYLRAEFTQAGHNGKEILNRQQDVHMKNNIECVDCHEPNRQTKAHADLRRDVSCDKCHAQVVRTHAAGPHRNVDCAACHTRLIGGYAFNFWSAVGPAGAENPLTRIQDYQVEAIRPLLIKNPKGIWIPVHPVPHTSGNVKPEEVKLSKQLIFRNRPEAAIDRRYFSNDSYAITGLVRDLDDKDRNTMVWLNLDRIAHATGKSRDCDDCHASEAQKIVVKFEGGSYKNLEDGEYSIIADRKGLRVTDFKGADGTSVPPELLPFRDKWSLPGDFALPAVRDRDLYRKLQADHKKGAFTH